MSFTKKRNKIIDTNEYRIVFDLNFRQLKYDTSKFNPIQADLRIESQEIEFFFIQLYKEIDYFKSLTIKPIEFKRYHIVTWLIFAIIGSVILGLVSVYPDEIVITMLVIGSVLIFLALMLPLLHCCVHSIRNRRNKSKMASKIRKFLEFENETEYMKRGLRWNLNRNNISWIELWLDYKSKVPKPIMKRLPTAEAIARLERYDI